MSRAAVLPGPDSGLGLQSWLRDVSTIATVRPAVPENVPGGDGSTVLLIPGFFAGDWSMVDLKRFLDRLGYRTELPGVWFNPGPARSVLERVESAFSCLSACGSIHVLGQSLGGVFARDLGLRYPERVKSVITLCTPLKIPVTTPLAPLAQLLAPMHDPAWIARTESIARPLAVPVTAIYSRDDGIVDWKECLQEETGRSRNIEVSGAHTTVASSALTRMAIAQALASIGDKSS